MPFAELPHGTATRENHGSSASPIPTGAVAVLTAANASHGDFVRWHSGGYADAHKLLGVEVRNGVPQAIVWDARTQSVWSDRADLFVKVEAPQMAEAA